MRCKRRVRVFLAILGLVLQISLNARAQSQLDQPTPQASPNISSRKFAIDANGDVVGQKQSTGSDSMDQSTLEIPKVPRAFEGCWEGTVAHLDSWRIIKGPRLRNWIPKTFRLCFRRSEQGKFAITLYNTKLDRDFAAKHGFQVADFDSQTELVNSDGERKVQLHTVSRLVGSEDGKKIRGQMPIPGPLTTKGLKIKSQCLLEHGDTELQCESSMVATCSGAPAIGCNGDRWMESIWHLRYHRIPSQP